MSDRNQEALLQRVDALEKENRRMKRLGMGLLGASSLIALMSAAAPMLCKTVWAERLVLRNSSGQDVMTMDAYSGEVPTITMKADDGKRVRLSWNEGVLMDFLDKRGESATTVKINTDGETTIARREKDGDKVSMAK